MYSKVTQQIRENIIPKINEFQSYQDASGAITCNTVRATVLIHQVLTLLEPILMKLHQKNLYHNLKKDFNEWLKYGLSNKPQFDKTLSSYQIPNNGDITFFMAPIVTPNGPNNKGYWLECFLALRNEPDSMGPIEDQLPHPKNKCQSLRLLTASRGFSEGKCIVFFPENVKTKEKITTQNFAMFFFDKFYNIYQQETLVRAESIFDSIKLKSRYLNRDDCYQARVLWGYLHDYFHHCGARPFDKNIQVKMNFFVGLLEEIKVDSQTVIALDEYKFMWWEEITEFIILERLLRYPAQQDTTKNFDSATGIFLFCWLKSRGYCFGCEQNERLSLSIHDLRGALKILVSEIENIEDIEDDSDFKKAAESYVFTILKRGKNGNKFEIPDSYTIHQRNLAKIIPEMQF